MIWRFFLWPNNQLLLVLRIVHLQYEFINCTVVWNRRELKKSLRSSIPLLVCKKIH
jgi:hypothetical protein